MGMGSLTGRTRKLKGRRGLKRQGFPGGSGQDGKGGGPALLQGAGRLFCAYLGVTALLLFLLPALLYREGTVPGAGGEKGEIRREETGQETRPPGAAETGAKIPLRIYVAEEGRLAELELEAYIAGVVAAEMPLSFHAEALKAQAVAARTYALQKGLLFGGRGCGSRPGADLCTESGCCQAFDREAARAMAAGLAAGSGGAAAEGTHRGDGEPGDGDDSSGADTKAEVYQKVVAAVEATRGLVLLYGGEPVQAVYHSTCGGMTAAAAEVWGRDFPYLQPVADPFCRHSPSYRGETRLNLAALLEAVEAGKGEPAAAAALAGQTAGQGPLLQALQQGPSGRHLLLRLLPGQQRKPEFLLSGSAFRHLVGLPSTRFHWVVEGEEIIFFTQGHGHGVGLCQYGADGMGQAGYNFAEILEHYYRGTALGSINGLFTARRQSPL